MPKFDFVRREMAAKRTYMRKRDQEKAAARFRGSSRFRKDPKSRKRRQRLLSAKLAWLNSHELESKKKGGGYRKGTGDVELLRRYNRLAAQQGGWSD